MSTKFKVGDEVVCIKPFAGDGSLVGKKGVVIKCKDSDCNSLGVAFEGYRGHKCGGEAPEGNGRWGMEDEIELVKKSTSISKNKSYEFKTI